MMPPRPMPPYLPIYPESDHAAIQERYQQADREWQRQASFVMWSNSIVVLAGVAGVVAAALMGPQIVVDAMLVLAK